MALESTKWPNTETAINSFLKRYPEADIGSLVRIALAAEIDTKNAMTASLADLELNSHSLVERIYWTR